MLKCFSVSTIKELIKFSRTLRGFKPIAAKIILKIQFSFFSDKQ